VVGVVCTPCFIVAMSQCGIRGCVSAVQSGDGGSGSCGGSDGSSSSDGQEGGSSKARWVL
jgi:hypothetical protein